MKSRRIADFQTRLTEASKSVLLEVMTILGSYRKSLILVGGWAPYFLIETNKPSDDPFTHVGSIDVDIAVNPKEVGEAEYATIRQLLEQRDYSYALNRLGQPIPHAFLRKVSLLHNQSQETIEVDFLGPEYGGTGKRRRHQIVQSELLIRKARGMDIAFEHNFSYRLQGRLPNGAENEVIIQIADLVACLTMKGITIGERYSEKDAYDIHSLIAHYQSGAQAVARTVKPHLYHGLVKEAMGRIAEKFATPRSIGPIWVADFLYGESTASPQARELILTDAYMQVNEFLKALHG